MTLRLPRYVDSCEFQCQYFVNQNTETDLGGNCCKKHYGIVLGCFRGQKYSTTSLKMAKKKQYLLSMANKLIMIILIFHNMYITHYEFLVRNILTVHRLDLHPLDPNHLHIQIPIFHCSISPLVLHCHSFH